MWLHEYYSYNSVCIQYNKYQPETSLDHQVFLMKSRLQIAGTKVALCESDVTINFDVQYQIRIEHFLLESLNLEVETSRSLLCREQYASNQSKMKIDTPMPLFIFYLTYSRNNNFFIVINVKYLYVTASCVCPR